MLRVEDLNDIGLTEWCVKQWCECWFILLHHPTICISGERVEPSPLGSISEWWEYVELVLVRTLVLTIRSDSHKVQYPCRGRVVSCQPADWWNARVSPQRMTVDISRRRLRAMKILLTDKIFFHVWANNNWVYVNNIHRGNVIISGEKYLHSCKKYFRAGMARAAVEARAACVSAAQWPVRPGEAPHSAAQCHHSAAAGTTTFLFWFLLSSTLHSRFSTWNSRKLIWTPWWRWVVTNCRVSTVFYLLSYNQSFVVTFSKHKHDYLSIFIHFIHYLSMYLCICFRLLHIAL